MLGAASAGCWSAGVLGAAGCWSAQLMVLRVLECSWVQVVVQVVAQVLVLRVLGCSWVLRVMVQVVI